MDSISKDDSLELVGVHCHLGSTITNTGVFETAAKTMRGLIEKIQDSGFNLKFLNMGGGLGVDYSHTGIKQDLHKAGIGPSFIRASTSL